MAGRPRGALLAAEAAGKPSFWEKVNFLGDCWEWTGATTEWGYGKLRYGGHDLSAHRCSYEYAFGRLPNDLWVLHKCDNPPCVNPAHLFLGTPKDNTQDMYRKGRAPRLGAVGEANVSASITEEDVLAIRFAFADGVSPSELSNRFGLTTSGINSVIRGKTWKHVGGPICNADRRGRHGNHRKKAA